MALRWARTCPQNLGYLIPKTKNVYYTMPYGIFLFSSYWDCKTLKQKFIGKSTLQHFIRFCFQYALFIQKSGFQAYVVLFDQSCSVLFNHFQSCSIQMQCKCFTQSFFSLKYVSKNINYFCFVILMIYYTMGGGQRLVS